MELNEENVRSALKDKGMSISELCEKMDYSEASMYRFFKNGRIRLENERKMRNLLGIERDTQKSTVSSVQNLGMFDMLLKRIEELTIENYNYRLELGKFNGICFALGA